MDATPRELSYSQAIQEAMAIAMEADERKFTNMSAGIGGVQSSHNINIMNR